MLKEKEFTNALTRALYSMILKTMCVVSSPVIYKNIKTDHQSVGWAAWPPFAALPNIHC